MPDDLKIGDTVWIRAKVIALPRCRESATFRISLDDGDVPFLLSVPIGSDILGKDAHADSHEATA